MENRIIKFRVWNGEQMVSPDYIDRQGVAHWKENSIHTSSQNLLQFTGLTDKNGKEIFEGDIVKFIGGTCDFLPLNFYGQKYEKGQILKVAKLESGFTLQKVTNNSDIPNVVGNITNYDFWNHQRSFEIIGNIFKNPELLT